MSKSLILALAALACLIHPSLASAQSVLENPEPGASESGIGLVSGWKCSATRIDVTFDGVHTLQAAYGTSREDTRSTCGDADNGFGLLINWNLLGDGQHTISVSADGIEFANTTFTVHTMGAEFMTGLNGSYVLPDFPETGRSVRIQWQESAQNFVIMDGGMPVPAPTSTPVLPHPTPTPAQTDSLARLIGTWNFTFTISSSTFTDTYRLQQIETSSSGIRGLVGLNEFGDTVVTFRVQELQPGSPVPFEFLLVDEEQASLCEFHFFDRTGETSVSGETFLSTVDSTGRCDVNTVGSPYAMTGVRSSTSSAVSAAEMIGRPLDDVKAAHSAAVLTELNALGERPPAKNVAVRGAIRAALGAIR